MLLAQRRAQVHCHPSEDSFSAHLLDTCVKTLSARGTSVKTLRLYGQDKQQEFPAVMEEDEWKHYLEGLSNPHLSAITKEHLAMVQEADALVFVYPTWWFGQPAMLKGWLEKVLLPRETFKLGEERFKHSVLGLAPGLPNIKRIAVVTTYGTPWLAVRYVGDPGRRIIARAIRPLCNESCTLLWLPLYSIDESTEAQRKAFVAKVQRAFQYF
jgi:putative NADPH-quinone reductase